MTAPSDSVPVAPAVTPATPAASPSPDLQPPSSPDAVAAPAEPGPVPAAADPVPSLNTWELMRKGSTSDTDADTDRVLCSPRRSIWDYA